MITVITEHAMLVTASARLADALPISTGGGLDNRGQSIIDAVEIALAETRINLNAAVDRLDDHGERVSTRHTLAAFERQLAQLARIDAALAAASVLPADVDVDIDLSRLRSEREVIGADLARNTLALATVLGGARVEIMGEGSA